jgi:hypothetical protein
MRNAIRKTVGALFCCLLLMGGAVHAQMREHAEASITLRLAAPPSVVFPLFGPVREAEWSPHWNPQILFPSDRAQVAGSVFTTKHGDSEAIWVMDTYDEKALRLAYVTVWPGMCVSRLEIALKSGANGTTEASVTYRYTALSEAGNEFVKDSAKEFPSEREHWEHAINHRLAELKEK